VLRCNCYCVPYFCQSLDVQHGAATALGFLIARHIYQERLNRCQNEDDVIIEDMEVEIEEDKTQEHSVLTSVVSKLGNGDGDDDDKDDDDDDDDDDVIIDDMGLK